MIRINFWAEDAQMDTELTYLHADHLDTPRIATNSSGTIVWQWNSDAFGSLLPNEDPDGNGTPITVNLRFPGQYFDKETGLHYNYFRDYDPKIGRYLESDPIGLMGGLNTFGYVGQNPLGLIDPFGLFYPIDFINGIGDLTRGRSDMIDAGTIAADAYFHCRANCEASRRGIGGYHAAKIGSSIREIIQNESTKERANDEAANRQGQCAGKDNPRTDCYGACANLIPKWGIPQRHLPPYANPNHLYQLNR